MRRALVRSKINSLGGDMLGKRVHSGVLLVFPIDTSSRCGRAHECNRRACLDVFVLFGLLEQGLSCTECSRGEDHE